MSTDRLGASAAGATRNQARCYAYHLHPGTQRRQLHIATRSWDGYNILHRANHEILRSDCCCTCQAPVSILPCSQRAIEHMNEHLGTTHQPPSMSMSRTADYRRHVKPLITSITTNTFPHQVSLISSLMWEVSSHLPWIDSPRHHGKNRMSSLSLRQKMPST